MSGAEKSMSAYLVCRHFGAAVSNALLQADTDTWEGWEFLYHYGVRSTHSLTLRGV